MSEVAGSRGVTLRAPSFEDLIGIRFFVSFRFESRSNFVGLNLKKPKKEGRKEESLWEQSYRSRGELSNLKLGEVEARCSVIIDITKQ